MSKTLFDHLNAIFKNQSLKYFDNLEDADKKTFQTYMINRLISMHVDYIPIVNEIQQYGLLSPREAYLFYSQLLPKGNSYSPYIKAKSTKEHDEWLIETVAKYFSVSKFEASTYITIFKMTPEGKQDLLDICDFYATDPKLLKKTKIWD